MQASSAGSYESDATTIRRPREKKMSDIGAAKVLLNLAGLMHKHVVQKEVPVHTMVGDVPATSNLPSEVTFSRRMRKRMPNKRIGEDYVCFEGA